MENKMINQLEYDVEKRAELAENLDFCKGIKLLKIKDTVASMLSIIGKNELFEQYTVHDISHINQMLNIAEWLIPEKTKNDMTSAEWLMLTLSIYLHDLGMVVSKNEFTQRDNNPNYVEYKKQILEGCSPEYQDFISEEKYLYQEYVRKHHARRIKSWLDNKCPAEYGIAKEQCDILNSIFSCLSEPFKNDLAMICESHHMDDLEDFHKYKIKYRYSNEKDASVNLNYIAIILRCTDLLHITNDRTPSIERKLLDISNPISVLEWEKQRAVKAISSKEMRNSEGNIDKTIEKDTIEITAHFSGADTAEAYFGLSSYLQYLKKELVLCNKIANLAKRQEGSTYDFPWKNVDESNISTAGFEAKRLSFTIEQENILKLLVGHTLYNDSSVVVRELAQNSIDAIKLQKLNYNYGGKRRNTSYNGQLVIDWNSEERTLAFKDNGTGMTIYEIENYLLKVGASKYRQKQFEEQHKEFNPISRFGIGILTCFMVANNIDIETNSTESTEVNIICLRNVNGKYLLKKKNKDQADPYIKKHGTIIKLHVRSDVDMSDLELNLKKWIITTEVPIELIIDGSKRTVGHCSLKEALEAFLKEEKYEINDENIKVEEKTIGNVTVACALKYNKYISDWSFLTIRNLRERHEYLPIGTCVEGIRVEFTTPGYKNQEILALANIEGSKFQTNVARTALEYDSSNEALKSIYDCYRLFLEDQIKSLEEKTYSKEWALEEGMYLMLPLLKNGYHDDKIEPIDEKLLIKSLSDIACIFVENNEERNIFSVNEVSKLSQFDILDYKIIQAIESLFLEVPTNITVTKMMESIIGLGRTISDNPIITNFKEHNIIHSQILNQKQASRIVVDTDKRKIQLTYSDNTNIWNSYDIVTSRRSYSMRDKLNLPIDDFVIEGLGTEIGVKTVGGIYLNSNSELCKYLKKIVALFEDDHSKESQIMLNIFLDYVFDSNFLDDARDEKDFDYLIRRYDSRHTLGYVDEMTTKMWEKIDIAEFKKVVLVNKHSIYSLDNWNRASYAYI